MEYYFEEWADIENARDDEFDPTDAELDAMGVEWMSVEAVKQMREEDKLQAIGLI